MKKTDIQIEKGTTVSTSSSAIPCGFFDDVLQDAKARKVDLKALEKKQLDEDWEKFQTFVADAEEKSKVIEKEAEEEQIDEDTAEKIENMKYLNKYRKVLERTTALISDSNKRSLNEVELPEIQDNNSMLVAKIAAERALKKQKQLLEEDEGDDGDSDEDGNENELLNWRSRGL